MSEKIYNKFTVIKNDDIDKYLAEEDAKELKALIQRLCISRRCNSGKRRDSSYFVVNQDEPYADLVKKLILKEVTADEITETIARNCVAWDTSKDKREGLLPEVAVFRNPYLYRALTGEEYSKYKAIEKFNINEE